MKKLYILLISTCCFWACNEDLGNYDYVELKNITIAPLENMTVLCQQQVKIDPVITGIENEEAYSYVWYAFAQGQQLADTLSESRVLDTIITLFPSDYTIVFEIKEKDSGIFHKVSFTMIVLDGSYGKGLLIYSNNNGYPQLSMLNTDNEFFPEIPLKRGEYVAKNPVKIAVPDPMNKTGSSLSHLFLMCDDGNGGYMLDPVTLRTDSIAYNQLFGIEPQVLSPREFYAPGFPMRIDVLINGCKFYRVNRITAGASMEEVAGDYQAESYIFGVPGGQPWAPVLNVSLYDNTQKCFLSAKNLDGTTPSVKKANAKPADKFFDPAKIDLKLIYGASRFYNKFISVFENDQKERFVLTFTVDAGGVVPKNKLMVNDLSGMNDATCFAEYTKNTHLYYASGTKVYCLNADAATPGIAQLGNAYDFGAPVSFMKFNTNTKESNILWVVTTENGQSRVHLCTVLPAGGIASEADPTPLFTGEVVDLYYKGQ